MYTSYPSEMADLKQRIVAPPMRSNSLLLGFIKILVATQKIKVDLLKA